MKIRISEKTSQKIKEKHGLEWDDVRTVFEEDGDRVDVRNGETGVTYGLTVSGRAITVITIRKTGVRWIMTARPMTSSEKGCFGKGSDDYEENG